MNYKAETEKVKQFAENYLNSNANDHILYHDIAHTKAVVASATKLAKIHHLNEEETFIVITACWFHDAGYYNGPVLGHEKRGADIAAAFLRSSHIDDVIIDAVYACILSTKMPQQPITLLDKIVCDADLSHLATGDFSERNKLLRKETEAATQQKISKVDWRKSTLSFLEGYSFHTEYGKTVMDAGRLKNIEKLKERVALDNEKMKMSPDPLPVSPNNTIASTDITPNSQNEIKPNKEKKKKTDRPERGIETMFRISSSNHQRLSDMADNKAHIMITTTSIIISVVLSVLLRKLEDNAYLAIPVVLLLIVCVVTMVFCILATRPSIPHGTFTQKDIDDKTVNLLFFGNFYRMSLDEYSVGVKKMMEDREFLYGTLTRDVYAQGVVLGKKYNLLRIGYSIFMFGIIASVLAFIIATVFFGLD